MRFLQKVHGDAKANFDWMQYHGLKKVTSPEKTPEAQADFHDLQGKISVTLKNKAVIGSVTLLKHIRGFIEELHGGLFVHQQGLGSVHNSFTLLYGFTKQGRVLCKVTRSHPENNFIITEITGNLSIKER